MAEDVEVRVGSVTDAEELARLRSLMDAEDGIPEPHGFREHFVRWYERHGNRFIAVVAELDGRLIGTVWLERVERVPRPAEVEAAPLGYVTFTFVEREHRNRGVGESMLARLRSLAVADGYETLVVWPSQRSVLFYLRGGFKPPAELLEHVTAARNL